MARCGSVQDPPGAEMSRRAEARGRALATRLCWVASAAFGLAACQPSDLAPPPDSPEGLPYAYAMFECAPWDGAATSITLSADTIRTGAPWGSEVPRPHVWMSVYQPAQELAGKRFEIDQERIAGAMRCEAGVSRCEPARSGWVDIRSREEDGSFRGLFRLLFDDGSTIGGGFRAKWYDRQILCG